MNRLVASMAVGLLLGFTPVLAESQTFANETLKEPSMQAQAEPSETTVEPSTLPGQSSEAAKPVLDLSARFLDRQKPDELLATDLIGRPAVNAENKTIGDVNDLVTDRSGKTIAVIIGVGGFLGIGEKDVAVPFDALGFTRDEDNDVRIVVDIDKTALTAAPDYQSLDDQAVLESAAKSEGGSKTHTY
ncbi:MAG: PRC-barrel domain-containing protein [Methyloceanibacter sp.]